MYVRRLPSPVVPPIFMLIFMLAAAVLPASAQMNIGTVPVENGAYYLAANPATNMVYVANSCGTDPTCSLAQPGTVTVINGATNTVAAMVTVGYNSQFLVINSVTNKICVSNRHDNTISVINGATNTVIKTISVRSHPVVGDVDPVTNKIYFVNNGNGQGTTISVIDGNTDTVTATVGVGNYPVSLAVDSVTNKIYVANYCGNQFGCNANPAPGTVSVIDGTNNTVTNTVTVGYGHLIILVNSVTNQIYVANSCGNTSSCDITGNNSNVIGTVTQIDGASLATHTVSTGQGQVAMAVNAVANKVYISNNTDNTESFIDGATLNVSTVNVGPSPADVEVDVNTDTIFVCDSGTNTVTVINGATLATSTVTVGNTPVEAWVNPVVNRIYVSNVGDDTVSVLSGVAPNAIQFTTVPPCRLVDTRTDHDPIQGGTSRIFYVPQLGGCNIPTNATAYSLNVTVVPPGPLGFLTIWPTGENQPYVSTLNSNDGRTKANAAIVPAGYQGAVSVYVTNTTDLVLDIVGYFTQSTSNDFTEPTSSTNQFYPLPPCRVIDTRNPNGQFGGPFLTGLVTRSFPVGLSTCLQGIPPGTTIMAYSFSVTAQPPANEPHQPLGFLTVFPDNGGSPPTESTLNNDTATTVANAAIVPAGSQDNGGVSFYPSQDTDVIVDINGYFAAPVTGGLSFYPVAPCRVIDTRLGNGAFTGLLNPPVNPSQSPCATPGNVGAYVFNATVVPSGPLGFLTLAPHPVTLPPSFSTLNADDGLVTSNMAIVPNGTGSLIDAYAGGGYTQLILDISGYFAP